MTRRLTATSISPCVPHGICRGSLVLGELKMTNKKIIIILCFWLMAVPLVASLTHPSSIETKVLDIVHQFPAGTEMEKEKLCTDFFKLGEKGILYLLSMVAPPGQEDDSKVRFAINGLAVYAGQKGREQARLLLSESFVKALKKPGETNVKAFIIRQLQLVGKKEAVKPLSRFLSHSHLCGPAARALQTIHSHDSEKALLKAMSKVSVANRIIIINALAELESRQAAKKIASYADSENPGLRQAALFALANIGDPVSEAVLSHVRVSASNYERSKAPSLYLLFARRLAERGYERRSVRIAKGLLSHYSTPGEIHIACAALSLLVDILKQNSLPELLAVMESPSAALRGQALELAFIIQGQEATESWVRKAKTSPPIVKTEIIRMLGQRGDGTASVFLASSLDSPEMSVRTAAAMALTSLQGVKALPQIISHLSSAEAPEEIAAYKQALLMMPGEAVIPEVLNILDKVSPPACKAIINILTEKLAVNQRDKLFAYAQSEDESIRLTALKGLVFLAQPEDLPLLIKLYRENEKMAESKWILDAAVAASNRINDIPKRADALLEEIQQSSGKKKAGLIRILPQIGGDKAFLEVNTNLENPDTQIQTAAVVALSQWPAFKATDALLNICRSSQSRKFVYLAAQGYVRLVSESGQADESKLDLLKKALEIPMQAEEKRLVVKGLSRLPIQGSLDLANSYFNDPALKPAAAAASARIIDTMIRTGRKTTGIDSVLALKKSWAAVLDPQEMQRIENNVKRILEGMRFVPLFNGRDLSGWKGLVGNPKSRAHMSEEERGKAQEKADESMRNHWMVKDGTLEFDGKGESLCTAKDYRDFEMLVDWKIGPHGDSGIYLRGTPQVQIWDPAQWPEGSGGLYNNKKGLSKPLQKADNPIGEWNTFYIKMIGERVTVYLNGILVADKVIMENYWERDKPIYPLGQIELQSHNSPLFFRNLYIREIPRPNDEIMK